MKMVAVSYERQILPGTFEHMLNHLIDHDIDLAPFAARYVNDETGAQAEGKSINTLAQEALQQRVTA